jgi:ELWxxDGT repeat protein
MPEMLLTLWKNCVAAMGIALLLLLAGCPAPKYALTALVTGQGSVAMNPPGGSYDADASVILAPSPAAGWHFDHWEGALSGNANPAQVTMDADKAVTAVFAVNQYALTVNVTGQGTVGLAPAGGTYDAGTLVTLTPTPAAGWHFDHWTGALSGNANPAQVTMDAAKTVTAVFAIDQYSLSALVTGQGSVALNPPGGTYDAGASVALTAAPAAGWNFDHWTGALSGSTNPAQLTMDAAKTVTAVFAANPLALSVAIDGGGAVTLDPPGGSYETGTVVSLAASPSTGWHFDHWEGALSGGATFVQLTMDAAKSVTAVFEREQYTLTLVATGGGSVTLDPPGGTYPFETVVTLTSNPDTGNRFEIWGGELAGTKQPITITMNANRYVEAYFMADTIATLAPNYLCAVGDTLYFLGTGPHSGRELWATNGTFEGTRLVRDLVPKHNSAEIRFLTNLDGTLYFFAGHESSYWLWTSDGTEEGTVPVANLGASSTQVPPAVVNGKLYFSTVRTDGSDLWVSDGTGDGTSVLRSFGYVSDSVFVTNPSNLTNANGMLYFVTTIQGDSPGMTLWRSNGTETGTVPAFSSRYISEIAGVNGQVLYYAGDDTVNSLWATDGTPEGTLLLKNFDFGPGDFEVSGGLLYFAAQLDVNLFNTQIWASDGTSTFRVDASSYRPWSLTNLNGKLLYVALYEVTGQVHCGLFATTGSGGARLREINPTLGYGANNFTAVVDDMMFFTAENSHGQEGLWKSDGTAPGTVMVSDISDTPVGIAPAELTGMNGKLYFSAGDVAHGHQLWTSDGTLAGTLPISCPTP